jgi:hypothetical protein
MKLKIFLMIFFLITIKSFSQGNNMNEIVKIILQVKNHFAKDSRTAIFNIKYDENEKVLTGETNLFNAKEKLLEELAKHKIEFKDEVELLPSKKLGDLTFGVVNVSVANIRSKPDHPAELATQSLLGTPVKIFKKEAGFYLVQTPDNYIAWVDDDAIIQMSKSSVNEWIKSKKIIFIKEFGFAYSKPDENSQRISDLVAGNLLIHLGEENNFFKVKYPDGRIAFVPKNHCKIFTQWLNELHPTQNSIVETAKLFLGVPYLWGGTSVKGMDCSGFTKTVYFLNGIILQRDASQQVNDGELVDTKNGFENLQPGDLLFFGQHATDSTKERVTHVGIYIGNHEFIHEAGFVKINSFDKDKDNFSEYRLKHFIRARRILTSIDKNGISLIKNHKFYFGEIK